MLFLMIVFASSIHQPPQIAMVFFRAYTSPQYIGLMVILSLCWCNTAVAQQLIQPGALGYYREALQFSQTFSTGSARIQGLGGAQNALGADLSALALNPAGIGMLNTSEFSIGATQMLNTSNANYLGSNVTDSRLGFNVTNLGVAFSFLKGNAKPNVWRGVNVAIGLNQVANYRDVQSFEGINTENYRLDAFVEAADGIPATALDAEFGQIESIQALTYFAFLINPIEGDPDNRYFPPVTDQPARQTGSIITKGSNNNISLAISGNYANRFYFGIGLGVNTLRSTRTETFTETILYAPGERRELETYTMEEILETRGTGFSSSLGVIVRPLDYFRIGASVQFPTFYFLTERYETSVIARYDISDFGDGIVRPVEEFQTLPASFNYRLQTPLKASGGAVVMLGKLGFLSADIDYIDYTTMRLSSAEFPLVFEDDNLTIQSLYKPVFNYRIGAEVRLSWWRLRGGYAIYGDPFNAIDDIDRSVRLITAGVGQRLPNFYWDLSAMYNTRQTGYSPYVLSDATQPFADIRTQQFRIGFTYGVYF